MLFRRKIPLLIVMSAGVVGGAIWGLRTQAAPPDSAVSGDKTVVDKTTNDNQQDFEIGKT